MSLWEEDRQPVQYEKEIKSPWVDPIVGEVRSARAALFAAVGFDLEKLAERLREKQSTSGHPVLTLPPRQPGHGSGEAT